MATKWTWVRLYGTHWGAEKTAPAEKIARAEKSKSDSERKITQMLADGWEIVSVVPQAPNGHVELWRQFDSYPDVLRQETWTVFLTKREIS